jgi:hypothetical protein
LRKFLPFLLLAVACASATNQPSVTSQPGRGAITITVTPNPIVAQSRGGDVYDFPFEVILRETGGRAVNIDRVVADVYALGGIPVGGEKYDAARIRQLGFPTTIAANGEQRYRFSPRQSVPDERLFGGVTAKVRIEGTDDAGNATTASTNVTVTR